MPDVVHEAPTTRLVLVALVFAAHFVPGCLPTAEQPVAPIGDPTLPQCGFDVAPDVPPPLG